MDELRNRLAAHKKDVEAWKAQVDAAGKQPPPPAPVLPPVSPPVVGEPVPPEVTPSATAAESDPLVADINAIRAKAEWITPRQAGQKGASLSINGYDGFYAVPSGTAPYLEQQAAAIKEAGARIDQEIQAEMAKDKTQYAVNESIARRTLNDVKDAQDKALRPFQEVSRAARSVWETTEDRVLRDNLADGMTVQEARASIYTNEEWKAARAEWLRTEDRLVGARKEWDIKQRAARDVWLEAKSAQQVAQRDATMRVVGRLRDFGQGEDVSSQLEFVSSVRRPGAAKGTSQKEAQASIKEASAYYPTDWLVRTRPIDAGIIGRGYHMDFGSISVIRTSRRAGMSVIAGDSNSFATSVHELAHEMESNNALIKPLEKAFYEYRTAGEALKKGMAGYGRGEVGRPDKFFSAYAGRDYDGRYYELLSMGTEDLWSGANLMDPEYKQWVLAMLTLLP